jgi:DUF971 family protein
MGNPSNDAQNTVNSRDRYNSWRVLGSLLVRSQLAQFSYGTDQHAEARAKMSNESPPPQSIERLSQERALSVTWHDGLNRLLPYLELRAQCMCARCVDEITGQRILDVEGIDPSIMIDEMQLVGNYALKIRWSDGHDTGLYTWEHLRRLCEAAQV